MELFMNLIDILWHLSTARLWNASFYCDARIMAWTECDIALAGVTFLLRDFGETVIDIVIP